MWELLVKHEGKYLPAAKEAGMSRKRFAARCQELRFTPESVQEALDQRANESRGALEDKIIARAHALLDDGDHNPEDSVKFIQLALNMKNQMREFELARWQEWNTAAESEEERQSRERREELDRAMRAANEEVGDIR